MKELSRATDIDFGAAPDNRGARKEPVAPTTLTVRNSRRVLMEIAYASVVWAVYGLGGIVGGRNRDCQATEAYTTTPDTPSWSVGLRGPNWPSVGSAQQNQASVSRGGRRRSGASSRTGLAERPAFASARALSRENVAAGSPAPASSTRRLASRCSSSIRGSGCAQRWMKPA